MGQADRYMTLGSHHCELETTCPQIKTFTFQMVKAQAAQKAYVRLPSLQPLFLFQVQPTSGTSRLNASDRFT